MTPVAWAVKYPDGRIDCELVGTQREVEWWCSTDEGRAAGRQATALYTAELFDCATILRTHDRGDGRRMWVTESVWLYPGQVLAVVEDLREVAQSEEPRHHTPEVGGSTPPLATEQEQA